MKAVLIHFQRPILSRQPPRGSPHAEVAGHSLDLPPVLRQTVGLHPLGETAELGTGYHSLQSLWTLPLAAVRRLEHWVSIGEAARALEVNPNVLHRWRREFRQGPGNAFPGNGKPRWSEGRIAELERKVGQQALEIDFLKGCLQRIEEQPMLPALPGNPRPTRKSWKP